MLEFALGLIGNLLAAELGAWAPKLAQAIVVRAANRIPSPERERLLEEWQALLADIPGDISKLVQAISLYRSVPKIVRDCDAQRWQESLTTRERLVVDLVARGLSNRDIAKELCITEQTVRFHLNSIFVKSGLERGENKSIQLARLFARVSKPPSIGHRLLGETFFVIGLMIAAVSRLRSRIFAGNHARS